LTPEADRYFPQRYDKMLNAVLREIRAAGGTEAVKAVFDRIGERSADRLLPTIDGLGAEARVAAVVSVLKASGVTADLETTTSGTLVLHEHSCPYASVVAENPECCSAIHTILERVVPGEAEQVESLATGGSQCRFEISTEPRSAVTP
jgi:predicted ArsR family transcriptional regulator